MLRLLILFVLLAPTFVLAQTASTVRYTVFLAGNRAGTQVTTVKADGVREVAFEFTDRGRGPKLSWKVKLDAAGLPVSLDAAGNDYLKVPVTETFASQAGVGRWKNDAESGEKKLARPSFYVSLQSVPEELALLAAALLEAPNQQLALLPEGQAMLRRGSELTVQGSGGARRVRNYEISGLDFSPSTVWLDDQGRFFAAVSAWMSVVREGWEDSASTLLEEENKRANERTLQTARLADLILVDGDPARRISDIRNTDLVIKDGKVYEPAALYRSIGVQPR